MNNPKEDTIIPCKRQCREAKQSLSFYIDTNKLHPNGPSLKVEPAADNNVAKVTENCLFMRIYPDSDYGGRYSMSWSTTVGFVLTWALFTFFTIKSYYHEISTGSFRGSLFEYMNYVPLLIAAIFFIDSSWIFIPWRRQLPIIFNRKTNKVTCFIDGHVVSEDFNSLKANIRSFIKKGHSTHEGIPILVFQQVEEKSRPMIKSTRNTPMGPVSVGVCGAGMVWEYIRLYMREGVEAVPLITPINEYRLKNISDSFRHFNPLKALDVDFWWYPIAIPFFIFIALPLAPVVIIGDLLYYALDHILPRRSWPKELIDACEGVWDGNENSD
ncbi:hypothetical protein [Flavobacterium collinsii]|uniref:Uncharacterized protein n=1 Tax=Flavobacterium collinsii TaxID=1114861 RepID=A0ABN7EQZ4_9FLAO|nr:hypothetical protein [Flavobacterium collinsii]CAA9200867.1 hypothetical protein FLACOL7796_03489 [Flavobacterium collinsii]